ncbi:serine/threonine-protein kinase [Gammaproteobacteria bacterium AS21]
MLKVSQSAFLLIKLISTIKEYISVNKDYKYHLAKQGFEIKEQIGSGLSGGTYKALQTSLKRNVAIKFFDNSLSKKDESLRKRFIRESRILADLQHPSIPYVLTKGDVISNDENIPYTVMQHIQGVGLDCYLKEKGRLDLNSTLHIAFQLLNTLDFVHKKGVVHRDIKPSNIMILTSDHCFLIDFSIGFKLNVESGMTRCTRIGDHLGSVNYMSPEQSLNMEDVDGRSDLYSLTKVICELLTGKPDISGLSEQKLKLNPAIKKVLSKGGSYSCDERYLSANDYLRELKKASSNINRPMDMPSRAVCVSTDCPDANWSSRGYYRGPNFIAECTHLYCTSCSNALVYKCSGCDQPIEDNRFCGGCGTEQFFIPECKICGSYLEKADIGKNTEELGCGKCRRKLIENESKIISSRLNEFDELPF